MANVGELLKNARESKGISLSQAEEDTKIRKKYLQALEDGKYDVIPGRVYAKGFLRIYAKYLGLDHEEINHEFAGGTVIGHDIARPNPAKPKRSKRPIEKNSRRKTFLITAVTAVAAIIILVAYSFYSENRVQPTGTKDDSQQTEQQKEQQTPNSNDASDNSQSASNPGSEIGTSQKPAPGVLEIKLVDREQECWAKVRVDGTVVFERNMKPGETQVFTGQKIRFTLGNAGAVEVFKNGESLGSLGSYGQVVTDREYTADQLTQ